MFSFTTTKDDMKSFLQGVESGTDVNIHRVFKILERRYAAEGKNERIQNGFMLKDVESVMKKSRLAWTKCSTK